MKQKFTIAIVAILSLTSCSSTRNLSYITDSEMMLAMRKIEKFDNNFLLYREGASGANGGKSGGGCGCN
jgi:Domain of unknown function (DUF4266)